MNSIAFIAPYEAMAEMAKEACKGFEKPITIEVGDLQEGLKKARLLVEKGIEVIISRGGTAKLLKNELAIPVVEIEVTAYDILEAFRKVSNKSQKIGIIGFENVIYGSHKLGDLLDLDLTVLTVQKEEEVPEKIGEARKRKVGIIIGDKVVVSHAKELGYPCLLIESGRESILQSFHDAYKILEVVRSEQDAKIELERKVKERTAELGKVNEQLSHEIEKQKQIYDELKKSEMREKRMVLQLQDALANIKTLRGLIPICASCKKIRDDKGYWGQIEAYIRDHSEAEFSHGLCPECVKKLYPDFKI